MSTRTLFGRNKAIEQNIDALLDKVSETGLLIVETIYRYLDTGKDDAVEAKVNQVAEIKHTCSRLRREIETELYSQMLIPDLLGDVVSLIEAMHQLVERVHHAMRFSRYYRLSVPEFLVQDAKELATAVGNTLENTVLATRAFFRDFTHVRDFVHKVGFYESECDEIRDRMLEKIYGSDLTLAEMDHFASSVRELDSAADDAERIGNMLTIYAIKRAE